MKLLLFYETIIADDIQMKIAADELIKLANELTSNETIDVIEMKRKFVDTTEAMLRKDIADNKAIGTNGANAILAQTDGSVRVLTHCNTGSLATAGYGTALGKFPFHTREFCANSRKKIEYFTNLQSLILGVCRCCAKVARFESVGACLLH